MTPPYGAALLAGVGIGLFPDVRTAVERCIQFEESITPDRENHEKYGRYFAIYRMIHDALAPVEKLIHETFEEGKLPEDLNHSRKGHLLCALA